MSNAKSTVFRMGRVTVYLRSYVWYLRYYEHGQRRQVRAATDRGMARQLAAQVNAQLETGAPAMTSFEPVNLPELRRLWLAHHEDVLRSSVATINRYRTATDHLLTFTRDVQPIKQAAAFREAHAESFVRHLRHLEVSPNGHAHTARRRLRDKGVKFVLEVCRTMFNFALKRRHLPPYAENPFTAIQIDRMPVEDAKAITLLTAEQERVFLEACDDWEFPIFLTLLLTGLRPGELTHLLLPDDLDLQAGWLYIRNKPELGWQVKTRNERRVPLGAELVAVLRLTLAGRVTGPVFLRRKALQKNAALSLLGKARSELRDESVRRVNEAEQEAPSVQSRQARQKIYHRLRVDLGGIEAERLRVDFMRLTKTIGIPHATAPKLLRHMFATAMQEANTDPLVRQLLMGHAPGGAQGRGGALGMTAVYTHTQATTLQGQLEQACRARPALLVARGWLAQRSKRHAS